MTTVVLLNPQAGSVSSARAEIEAYARERGWELTEIATEEQTKDALHRALEQEAKTIVAAGGDGTISHVAHLLHTARPDASERRAPVLGVLPVGTGNDLARSLGIPLQLSDALRVLDPQRAPEIRRMDLLELRTGETTRLATNAINIGVAKHVESALSDDVKASWGPFAYLGAALQVLGDIEPFAFEFRLDDGKTRATKAIAALIANGGRVAGGLRLAPSARVDDGSFGLVVLRDTHVVDLLAIAAQARLGVLREDDVWHEKGSHVTMRIPPGTGLTVDGEAFELPASSTTQTLTIRCLPGALPTIVGHAGDTGSETED